MRYHDEEPAQRLRAEIDEPIYPALFLPMAWGAVLLVFLVFANLGTSYQFSNAPILQARVAVIDPVCRLYSEPGRERSRRRNKRGVGYNVSCKDEARIREFQERGFIYSEQTEQTLTLDLQANPLVQTRLIMPNEKAASLRVGDFLAVRVPKLRNGEKVEIATEKTRNPMFTTALYVALFANAVLWFAFSVSFRRAKTRVQRSTN